MRKLIYGLLLIILYTSVASAQNNGDFKELDDPTEEVHSDWGKVSKGLHVSFVTKDKRFKKHVPPQVDHQKQKLLKGWKGEKVAAQLLLWTKKDIENVKINGLRFTNEKTGGEIKGKANFVRYVMTDEFAGGCGARKPEDFAASLSPDVLDDLEYYNISEKSVRPVWISVEIPRNAAEGEYQATIQVEGEGVGVQELKLKLEVLHHKLPEPKDWEYHLDLWQNPAAVARVNDLELWSDAHFKMLKPLMKRLAKAGQKVVTTTLNKDPWNVQTYDAYGDMIIWNKDNEGNWHYDYTNFDKYVELMFDVGIDKMINAYSIVPWNNEIHYKNEDGEFVDVEAKPGTDEFEKYWKPFLKDFSNHLQKKGWLTKTNIALDERSPEEMEIVFNLIEEVVSGLGVSYADNQKTYKKYPDSEDVSIAADHPYERADLQNRTKKGLNTTFYIYCGNEFMNTFTFSDPAEATYAGWYALANDFNGMLRWSFNSWTESPLQDSRFRAYAAGDTYIVYPKNRSSIRFERLIEGIQDYEKARIIKKELKSKNATKDLQKLNEAIDKLASPKRNSTWNKDLNEAKALLNTF